MKAFTDLRIVFFGTPDFAVASLRALVEAGCKVVGVVTAPDKPAGRGMQLQQPAVKAYALSQGLQVLQPPRLKAPEFLEALRALQADLQVVVAFRMLPELVWNMPPMGTINVHGSLLPQYRGAAPINWAIINGEAETGVTTFKLRHEIDTGDLLLQDRLPIGPDDNAGTVHDVMMEAGARLLVRTVRGLAEGTIREIPQDAVLPEALHHAPKIFKEDCRIDWNQPARAVRNKIRGLAPYPAAFTILQGKTLKIYQVGIRAGVPQASPGTFETDGRSYLRFAAADAWVEVLDLQLEGKKRMDVEAFLRGFRLTT
jgi:methionyl-tRNA formyltransferase